MGKKSEGKSAGRKTWAEGSKLTYLDARKQEFLDAQDSGPTATGQFYNKMTRLFLLRYGWDLPLHKDGPILQEPLESSGAVPLDMSDISDEVAARRRKRYDELRKVNYRFTCCNTGILT
jgi:hypothetical protein